MKEIKKILFAILVAIYTSGWWVCGIYGIYGIKLQLLWSFMIIITVLCLVFLAMWFAKNWDEK